MNYTVVWVPSAEAQLAAIWMRSPDRESVTVSSARIDSLLGDSPLTEGESRPDGYRVIIELPLTAYFQVIPDDCLVKVLRLIG